MNIHVIGYVKSLCQDSTITKVSEDSNRTHKSSNCDYKVNNIQGTRNLGMFDSIISPS